MLLLWITVLRPRLRQIVSLALDCPNCARRVTLWYREWCDTPLKAAKWICPHCHHPEELPVTGEVLQVNYA